MFKGKTLLLFLVALQFSCSHKANEPKMSKNMERTNETRNRIPATETDNFTDRYVKLEDSFTKLNKLTNKLIQEAIDISNKERKAAGKWQLCNEDDFDRLYYLIDQKIGKPTWAELELAIERSTDFDKKSFPKNPKKFKFAADKTETIYKNLRGFMPWMTLEGFGGIGSNIRLGKHIVGTDKVGHFTGIGYVYFLRFLDQIEYFKNRSNKKVKIKKRWKRWLREKYSTSGSKADLNFLKSRRSYISEYRAFDIAFENAQTYGEGTEEGFFGKGTTGVYSFGDLVANYQGMLWWFKLAEDPRFTKSLRRRLKSPKHLAHIRCEEKESGHVWRMIHPMKWEKYIDSDMDEGVNCNEYKNDKYTNRIKSAIQDLQAKDPKNRYTCPIDISECKKLAKKYRNTVFGDLTERLISPECLEAANYYSGKN